MNKCWKAFFFYKSEMAISEKHKINDTNHLNYLFLYFFIVDIIIIIIITCTVIIIVRTQQPKLLIDFICISNSRIVCQPHVYHVSIKWFRWDPLLRLSRIGTRVRADTLQSSILYYNNTCEDAPHLYTYFSCIRTHKFCIEIDARARTWNLT